MRIACLVLAIVGAMPTAICTLCSALGTAGSQTGEDAAVGAGILALFGGQFILSLAGGIMVMSKTGKGQKGTMGAVALVIAFILSIVSFNWLGTPFFLLAAIFGFIAEPKQVAVEVESATEQPPADV